MPAPADPRRPPVVTIVGHDVGGVGGMERQLSEVIGGLLEANAEVTVVSRTCELEPHPRLRWVRVPGPARPFVLAYPWFFVAGSLLVHRHRRGVLHTTGAIVFNRADVSTIHYCHDSPTARPLRRTSRPTVLHAANARAASILSRAAERLIYRRSRTNTLVCVSSEVARDVARAFSGNDVRVVPNGVDLDLFRPDRDQRTAVRNELGLAPTDLVAVFVGGDWGRKGLDIAIEAVRRAAPWRLVVVGQGDTTPYESNDSVSFVGLQENPARFYAAADAFVFPSAHESAPLVMLEAAASGLPLLVAHVGGLDEILRSGQCGWHLARDPTAFATKLDLLGDGDLRRRMGKNARSAALRLSWDHVRRQYVELYDELGSARSPDALVHIGAAS
jgi:glycosyltransferase involved in cell wall biosynthesis